MEIHNASDVLRFITYEQKISVSDLSRMLNVTPAALNSIVNGKKLNISTKMAVSIHHLFPQYKIEFILSGNKNSVGPSKAYKIYDPAMEAQEPSHAMSRKEEFTRIESKLDEIITILNKK